MDTKNYVLIILLTLVLGYFLGLMISTTVDYRLKDMIVNLPRPNTNIVIDKEILKIKTPYKNKQKINKNSCVHNCKIHSDRNINKKKTSKKKLLNNNLLSKLESFTSNINQIPIKNTKDKNNEDKNIEDKNILVYEKLYKNSSLKKNKDIKNKSIDAYNLEDTEQIYTSII